MVSFGRVKNSMQPQCTGVKEKIIRLVWQQNPKFSSEQSTGKKTVTTRDTVEAGVCWKGHP